MNEEEKDAISYLENALCVKYPIQISQKPISIVLNLIDKQQKEIAERDKYNITTLPFEELKEIIEQNKNISIFGKEYISKDKIREIFQFYIERDSLFNDDPHKMAVITLKDVLKELLEEN